jgi:hypothetical protein
MSDNMSDLRAAPLCLAVFLTAGTLFGLTGCATRGEGELAEAGQSTDSSDALVREAGFAYQSGDTVRTVTLLEQAAVSDPAALEPWLRLAQVHFETGDFNAALAASHEVLARRNNHHSARSIAAVSALRIANAQLALLQKQARLQGSVREEAELLSTNLTRLLHSERLVPRSEPSIMIPAEPRSRTRPPAARRGDRVARSPSPQRRSESTTDDRDGSPFNPFETLQSLPH